MRQSYEVEKLGALDIHTKRGIALSMPCMLKQSQPLARVSVFLQCRSFSSTSLSRALLVAVLADIETQTLCIKVDLVLALLQNARNRARVLEFSQVNV